MMEPLETTGERLLKELLSNTNRSESRITVNAGGIGIWVAVSACVLSSAMTILLGAMVIDANRRIDRIQDHQAALYMMAPEVRELVLKRLKESNPKE